MIENIRIIGLRGEPIVPVPSISRFVAAAALSLFLAAFPLFGATDPSAFYQKGTIYLDWLGTRSPDGTFFNQISARVRFDLISRPGTGWTFSLDARDRVGVMATSRNQVILYNARLTFDRPGSLFYLSLGQMNLYDSATTRCGSAPQPGTSSARGYPSPGTTRSTGGTPPNPTPITRR